MAMRCGFASAANAAEEIENKIATAAASFQKTRMSESPLRTNDGVILLGKGQQERYACRHQLGLGVDLGTLAGFALDRVKRVTADVERNALRNEAVDLLSSRIIRLQQVDTGAERHHLDIDGIRPVHFQKLVGDADDQPFLYRIAVR